MCCTEKGKGEGASCSERGSTGHEEQIHGWSASGQEWGASLEKSCSGFEKRCNDTDKSSKMLETRVLREKILC